MTITIELIPGDKPLAQIWDEMRPSLARIIVRTIRDGLKSGRFVEKDGFVEFCGTINKNEDKKY